MLIGSPLTDRANSHNGTLAPSSPQSSVAERADNHRERLDDRRFRRFLAGVLREIIDDGG
jgi:hypothetical protein